MNDLRDDEPRPVLAAADPWAWATCSQDDVDRGRRLVDEIAAVAEAERAEWEARLEAAVAATLRRRAARRQQHADHAAARAIGLQRRHHQKLHRKDDPS